MAELFFSALPWSGRAAVSAGGAGPRPPPPARARPPPRASPHPPPPAAPAPPRPAPLPPPAPATPRGGAAGRRRAASAGGEPPRPAVPPARGAPPVVAWVGQYAVASVAAGRRYIDGQLAMSAWESWECPLTDRELQVLQAAADGQEVEEIATAVYLTPGTIRNYLTAAVAKLNARNRIDAIRIAREAGWL